MKEHMQYIIDHAEEIEKLLKVKAQVSEVKSIMLENIDKVCQNMFGKKLKNGRHLLNIVHLVNFCHGISSLDSFAFPCSCTICFIIHLKIAMTVRELSIPNTLVLLVI